MLSSSRLVALDAGEGTVLLLFQRGESRQAVETKRGTVPGHDGSGPVHLAFAIDRKSTRYVGGLTLAERADRLAQAHGWKGSMAEYVLSTVTKLEEYGIHDRNLWAIQRMVAERIDHHWPAQA